MYTVINSAKDKELNSLVLYLQEDNNTLKGYDLKSIEVKLKSDTNSTEWNTVQLNFYNHNSIDCSSNSKFLVQEKKISTHKKILEIKDIILLYLNSTFKRNEQTL